MTHKHTSAHHVQRNRIVIYCNILFMYFRASKMSVFVPRSEVWTKFTLQKKTGSKPQGWNVKGFIVFCDLWMAAGWRLTVESFLRGNQQAAVFSVFLAIVTRVFSFIKQCCLKPVCMMKQTNKTFTMQERTCWSLCTIVILLMCKYICLSLVCYYLIVVNEREKRNLPQSNTSPFVFSTFRKWKSRVFSKAAFYYVQTWLKLNKF